MLPNLISIRLGKAATEFNVGVTTIVDFLHKNGFMIDSNPNTKLSPEMYSLLLENYKSKIDIIDIVENIYNKSLARSNQNEDSEPTVAEIQSNIESQVLKSKDTIPVDIDSKMDIVNKDTVTIETLPELSPLDQSDWKVRGKIDMKQFGRKRTAK